MGHVSTSQSDQLLHRVRRAAEGTPYVVRATDRGFDVVLELGGGRRRSCTHHVSFPGPGLYSVSDDVREVDWHAGAARVSARGSRKAGRARELSVEKVYVFDRRAMRFRKVSDQSYDTGRGRALIDAAATELGLRAKRSPAEVTGIVMAAVAAAGAAITVVTLVLGALLGWFS